MQTIKIIDLFNDIANNKKVPNKIKVGCYIYYFDINESSYTRYINNDEDRPRGLLEDIDSHNSYVWFNLTVEILEDKSNKIFEFELKKHKGDVLIGANMWAIGYKIKELTKAVNYLLEKSDSNDK